MCTTQPCQCQASCGGERAEAFPEVSCFCRDAWGRGVCPKGLVANSVCHVRVSMCHELHVPGVALAGSSLSLVLPTASGEWPRVELRPLMGPEAAPLASDPKLESMAWVPALLVS